MDGTRMSGGGNISTDPCNRLQDLGDLGAATRRAMETSWEVSPLERLGEWHPGVILVASKLAKVSRPCPVHHAPCQSTGSAVSVPVPDELHGALNTLDKCQRACEARKVAKGCGPLGPWVSSNPGLVPWLPS